MVAAIPHPQPKPLSLSLSSSYHSLSNPTLLFLSLFISPSSSYLQTHAFKAFRKAFPQYSTIYISIYTQANAVSRTSRLVIFFFNFLISSTTFSISPSKYPFIIPHTPLHNTMSTDLHLHHDLPKLRISPIKMQNDNNIIPSSENTKKSNNVNDENDNAPTVVSRAENGELNDGAVSDDDESYRTPTSKESKIPAILTCPPAPKKAKPSVSCKRKLLDEFQFFEVNNNEDMDAFFRSTFPKRTCPCT